MRSVSFKTGVACVAFSLVLAAACTVALLVFRAYAVEQTVSASSTGAVYTISTEDWVRSAAGATVEVDASKVTDLAGFSAGIAQQTLSWVPYAAGGLAAVFLVASLGLWAALKGIQERETIRLLEAARASGNSLAPSTHVEDPRVAATLEAIRSEAARNLAELERLNSYTQHDQRNELAALRARLQAAGDKEAVGIVDGLVAGLDDVLTLTDAPGHQEVVDVSLVCAEVVDRLSSPGFHPTFDFDESADTLVAAKRRWIYRAVWNPLENARRYGGAHASISVSARHGSVVVCVADDGPGMTAIPEDECARIAPAGPDGYGIGLSVARRVCDLAGGCLLIDSAPDTGARVYLSFPAASAADGAA